MSENETLHRCSKNDCPVVKTGLCIEGHVPLPTCPYYGRASSADVDQTDDDLDPEEVIDEKPAPEQSQVRLDHGEPLTPAEVASFLRARDARFVSIVGDRDSGKTTLICSIYEQFLRGPYIDHYFSESRTFIAFEKRCHPSRVASERLRPDTPHTSISDGLRYFHLALSSAHNISNRVDLMLSDRAGEVYKRARDNSESVKELVEIPQAHRVILLLDGRRVADPVTRAVALQSVRQSIRAFADSGVLGHESIVQVVTTKVDLLNGAEHKAKFDGIISGFRERLTKDFGQRVGKLSFFEVSARDPEGAYAPAYGVDKLLSNWIADEPRTPARERRHPPLYTEYDRLLVRTPMGVMP